MKPASSKSGTITDLKHVMRECKKIVFDAQKTPAPKPAFPAALDRLPADMRELQAKHSITMSS